LALLLPAVQAAREHARRIQCSSNLAQLGKFAVNHEQRKEHLPPTVYWSTNVYQSRVANPPTWDFPVYSWVHAVLPDIDPTVAGMIDNLDRTWNAATGGYDIDKDGTLEVTWNFNDPAVLSAVKIRDLPLLICPSDITTGSTYSGYGGALSYACNGGRENSYDTSNSPLLWLDWPQNGANESRLLTLFNAAGGPIFPVPSSNKSRSSIADISNGDGAANTVLFTENANLTDWHDPLDRPSTNPNPPATIYPGTTAAYRVTEYKVAVLWYNPAFPPPFPVAEFNRDMYGVPLDAGHARPAAFHPDGFMMCMADGSVRFVNEKVPYDVYAKLLSSNGKKCRTPGIGNENPIPVPIWQQVPIQSDQL